ncbi:MAG: hypothetical protein WBD02_08630 [Acidimicrobiia bacterium]
MNVRLGRLPRAPRTWAADEQGGFVAIEFVAGIALLIVPMVMIVSTLSTWFESRQSAEVIARQLAQAVADSPLGCSLSASDVHTIYYGAILLGSERGVPASAIHVDVNQPQRGASAHVKVGIDVPAAQIPFAGDIGSFRISMEAQAPVDQYRECP